MAISRKCIAMKIWNIYIIWNMCDARSLPHAPTYSRTELFRFESKDPHMHLIINFSPSLLLFLCSLIPFHSFVYSWFFAPTRKQNANMLDDNKRAAISICKCTIHIDKQKECAFWNCRKNNNIEQRTEKKNLLRFIHLCRRTRDHCIRKYWQIRKWYRNSEWNLNCNCIWARLSAHTLCYDMFVCDQCFGRNNWVSLKLTKNNINRLVVLLLFLRICMKAPSCDLLDECACAALNKTYVVRV